MAENTEMRKISASLNSLKKMCVLHKRGSVEAELCLIRLVEDFLGWDVSNKFQIHINIPY